MKYVLDTDTIIYLRKGHQQVEDHIASHSPGDILTTTVSRAELYYGAFHSGHVEAHVSLLDKLFRTLKTLAFCDKSAHHFGRLKADLRKKGLLIMDMDLMIASIALTNRITLVTNNTRDFARITDLDHENWLEA